MKKSASSAANQMIQIQTASVKALGSEFDVVYAEAGPSNGPVVIGVHGAPCTHNAFKGMVVPLVSAGYRVIIPDLPGNGVTDIDSRKVYNYTTPHKVAVLKGLIQALQIDRVVMMFGHSMGCHVAAHLAVDTAEEGAVQSLGLICTPGATPHRLLRPLIIHKVITTCLYWVLRIPIVGGIIGRVLSPVFAATGFKGRTPLAEAMSYYEAVNMDFPQFGLDCTELSRQGLPVLMLSSSNDRLIQYSITEQVMKSLEMRIEDIKWYYKGQCQEVVTRGPTVSQPVMFDDGTHFILNKYPEILAKEIIAFLQTLL